MLEILYNVYNLSDYFNKYAFKLYVIGGNGIYYYGFIDISNKVYTLNIEYSKTFKEEISLLLDSSKCIPYKNKDKIFVICD